MLRKLIKYEFRATARVMLPLYLVTIVLALLTRGASLWLELATFIVAVVLAVFRFRKNLLTDEGYVMFTLPVSPHSLVCSKLIVSTVWFLGAVVIDVVALVSLVADVAMFQEMGRMFREVFDNLTAYYLGNGVLFLVELVILFLVGCAYTCLSFYPLPGRGHPRVHVGLHRLHRRLYRGPLLPDHPDAPPAPEFGVRRGIERKAGK